MIAAGGLGQAGQAAAEQQGLLLLPGGQEGGAGLPAGCGRLGAQGAAHARPRPQRLHGC